MVFFLSACTRVGTHGYVLAMLHVWRSETLSLSTMWIPGIELGLLGLEASSVTH